MINILIFKKNCSYVDVNIEDDCVDELCGIWHDCLVNSLPSKTRRRTYQASWMDLCSFCY